MLLECCRTITFVRSACAGKRCIKFASYPLPVGISDKNTLHVQRLVVYLSDTFQHLVECEVRYPVFIHAYVEGGDRRAARLAPRYRVLIDKGCALWSELHI